jgi:hypothetical protein
MYLFFFCLHSWQENLKRLQQSRQEATSLSLSVHQPSSLDLKVSLAQPLLKHEEEDDDNVEAVAALNLTVDGSGEDGDLQGSTFATFRSPSRSSGASLSPPPESSAVGGSEGGRRSAIAAAHSSTTDACMVCGDRASGTCNIFILQQRHYSTLTSEVTWLGGGGGLKVCQVPPAGV